MGRGLGGGKIGGGQGVFGKHAISFLPLESEQRGRGGAGTVGRQGRPPAVLSMAAAGEWGKSERGTRGSLPRTHLGPRRLEEAVWRRRSEGGGGAKGGGAVGGRGARQCSIGAVWGEGVVVVALNRRRRSVWGGRRYFRRGHRRARASSRSPAGLLRRPAMRRLELLRSTRAGELGRSWCPDATARS
jgi:hypothetical protein